MTKNFWSVRKMLFLKLCLYAKYGWYRYEVRFALPVYDDKNGEVCRYNIFFARMLVRHDADDKKYLYDLLAIKKETSSPLE